MIKTLLFLQFFCDIYLPYVKFYSSVVDYIQGNSQVPKGLMNYPVLSIHEGKEVKKTNVFILEFGKGYPDHVALWQQWNLFIGQIQDVWACKINIEYLNDK